ncbi:hypothetical protein A1D31_22490 [Bradyrhizobium liaoningense]|nr:hypothetical protein A1D31_22490 [Bradyrhizobium liaoningense]
MRHGSTSDALHGGADEGGGWSGIDGVSEGAQLIHAGGNPISHETKAGFNAADSSVDSEHEIELLAAIAGSAMPVDDREALAKSGPASDARAVGQSVTELKTCLGS